VQIVIKDHDLKLPFLLARGKRGYQRKIKKEQLQIQPAWDDNESSPRRSSRFAIKIGVYES
jgi:hypothetical protein